MPVSSSVVAWYDASNSTSLPVGSGAVSQWRDLSPNSRHLVQSTTANQPSVNTTRFPQRCVDFSSGKFMGFDAPVVGNSNWTVWMVAYTPSGGYKSLGIGRYNGSTNGFGQGTAPFYFGAFNSPVDPGSLTTSALSSYVYRRSVATNNGTYAAVANGAEPEMYANGVSLRPYTAGSMSATTFAFDRVGGDSTGLYLADGAIAELIIFNRALNSSELDWLQNYAEAKWGVSAAGRPVGTDPLGTLDSVPAFDPDFDKVVALLDFDSSPLVDRSSYNHSLSLVGGAVVSSAYSRFGAASLLLNGSTSRVNGPQLSAFDFGTGDFTIEFWARKTTDLDFHDSVVNTITNRSVDGGWWVDLGSTGLRFGARGSTLIASGSSLSDGLWRHYAITRASGTFRMFVQGALITSYFASFAVLAPAPLTLGAKGDGVEFFPGYIDALRITKGLARYTTAFTPPTGAFPATTSPPRLIGEVRDDTNALCARVVRAYRRDTGALVASFVTDGSQMPLGQFSITVPSSIEHYLVFLDDDAGVAYNALVRDRVIPV